MNDHRKFRHSPSQPSSRSVTGSLFAIQGDLDGEQKKTGEFLDREQYIGLIIGTEEFLLSIAMVREIIMLVPITYVPNAPEFIDGVINLRGGILPAINLRKLMGIPRGEITPAARIIVIRIDDISCALLVDGIRYVIALPKGAIEQQAIPGKGHGAEFIASIANHGKKVQGIIDVARVLRMISEPLETPLVAANS